MKSNRFINIVLVVLLLVSSFLLGSLYTKVQYLEKEKKDISAGDQLVAAGKYSSFEKAVEDIATSVKLDGKKLVACMNGGTKKGIVDADLKEGADLGVNGTPAFFINGRLLAGAFPFASFKEIIDKEIEGKGSDSIKDYADPSLQSAYKQGSFNPVPQIVQVGSAPTKGAKGAFVTMVEFSDFQCPFCSRVSPTVKQILDTYGDKIQLAVKNFPLISIHKNAEKAAEAAECARDQGKYWEFHDKLFDAQADWSNL